MKVLGIQHQWNLIFFIYKLYHSYRPMQDFKVNGICASLERNKMPKIYLKIFGKVERILSNSKTRMQIYSHFFSPFRLIFATQRSSPRFLVCPIYFSLIESSRKRGSDGLPVVVLVERNIIGIAWTELHRW